MPSNDVSDFTGGAESDVAMMIGIGLVKDSPAVFFQYLGDDQTPAGLTMPSGKPVTSLKNITLSGVSIAENIGEFNSTKLNVFLTSNSAGRTVMLTSGLTTIWSQCVLGGLIGMFNSYDLSTPFNLDSWNGNSKMRPCLLHRKVNGAKVSDNECTHDALQDEARADRDKALVEKICVTQSTSSVVPLASRLLTSSLTQSQRRMVSKQTTSSDERSRKTYRQHGRIFTPCFLIYLSPRCDCQHS